MNRIASKLTTSTFCASVIVLLGMCSTRANDAFADRIILSRTNITEVGNNGSAGEEAGEPIGQGSLALLLSTLWYSWTAPTSGVVYVTGSAHSDW